MEKNENKVVRWILLILLGFIILTNILGLLIDTLIGTKLVLTPNINMRGLYLPAAILSIAFIFSGIVFWIKYLKRKEKSIMIWWHVLAGVAFLMTALKIVKPTILTTLIPGYFIIFFGLVILLWFVVYLHLKKLYKKKS